MGIGVEIVIVLLLILANGLFSLSETAVVSARKARLQQRAEAGDTGAERALALATNPNVFLATVQVGITLIGIFSGAFGGARLSAPLADALDDLPLIGRSADGIAFVAVVLVITYLSLVVGELVPKRIALNAPESVAAMIAGPMERLATAASPIIHLLSSSTDVALRLLRLRTSDDPPVTEEEVGVLLELGARAGVFDPAEQAMIEGVFELADARVTALMVPRPDIVWLDVATPPETLLEALAESPHSRFPLCRGDLDHMIGIVRARDLLLGSRSGALDPMAYVRPPLLVPESTSALRLLQRFRETGEHIAIVIDEYGGTAGLVTLGAVLEAVVGEVSAAGDTADPEAVQRDDGSWLLDGGMPVGDIWERLNCDAASEALDGSYATLGGFVLDRLDRIPEPGDWFEWGGWRFEVLDMDGHRVDKVLTTPASRFDGGDVDAMRQGDER